MSIGKSTLFLGDLSAFCSEADIHALFAPYGEVTEIKIMRSEETMRNLSYGFIKFSNSSSAKRAMNALDGLLFGGRHLKVGWASYKNKKDPTKILQHQDKMDSSSVHISYISYQLKTLITEESLRILFSGFGVVLDCSIKKSYIDQSINRQCGYGFVHFSSSAEGIESAMAAVAGLNDKTIDDVCYKCSISHNLEKHLLDLQTGRAMAHAQQPVANYMYEQPSLGYRSAIPSQPKPHSWAAAGNQHKMNSAAFQAQPLKAPGAYFPSPEKKNCLEDMYSSIDRDLVRSVRQQHSSHRQLSPPPAPAAHVKNASYGVSHGHWTGLGAEYSPIFGPEPLPKNNDFLWGSSVGSDAESLASSVGSSGMIGGPFFMHKEKSVESAATTTNNSSHSSHALFGASMVDPFAPATQGIALFHREEPLLLSSLRFDDNDRIASVPSMGPPTATRGFYDDLLKLSVDDREGHSYPRGDNFGFSLSSPSKLFMMENSFVENNHKQRQQQPVGGLWESYSPFGGEQQSSFSSTLF